MPRFLCAVAAVLFAAAPAAAQEAPRVEAFGGYSYGTTEVLPGARSGLNGWEASAAVNFNRYVGVELDASGHYGTKDVSFELPYDFFIPRGLGTEAETRTHALLAGPRVAARGNRATLFGHALLGGARREVDITTRTILTGGVSPAFPARLEFSSTELALAVGGGVDIRLTDLVSVRAVKADYLYADFSGPAGTGPHHARVSAGLVLTFGR